MLEKLIKVKHRRAKATEARKAAAAAVQLGCQVSSLRWRLVQVSSYDSFIDTLEAEAAPRQVSCCSLLRVSATTNGRCFSKRRALVRYRI